MVMQWKSDLVCLHSDKQSYAKNLRHFFFFLSAGARTEKWMYFVVLAEFNADLYVELSLGSWCYRL
jgi:hypothetical protein